MSSSGVPLTESLILQKTKLESLSAVKNLNLWGSDINDLSILRRCPNLEVLALSVNFVSSLKDLAECRNLKELYLRKNQVAALGEIQHLSQLGQLHTLWLIDNPCAKHSLYRLYAIHCCPFLKQLDNGEVTATERAQAQRLSQAQLHEAATNTASSAAPTAPVASAQATPQVSPARNPAAAAPAAAAPAAAEQPRHSQQPLGQMGANPRPSHQAPATSSVAMPAAQQRSAAPSISPSGTASASTAAAASRQTQKSIVSAILTLMNELSPESLEFLRGDIDERLRSATK